MTSDSKPIGPAEPVNQAEYIGFEPTDANVRNSIWTGIGIAVMTVLILVAAALSIKWFQSHTNLGSLPSPLAPARIFPPEPKVEVQPWTDFPKLRAHEEQMLSSYGVTRGEIRIPIQRAMDLIVPRLPQRPASSAIGTGQGRSQSNSVRERSGNAK